MIDQVKKRITEIEGQPEVDESADDDEGGEGGGRDVDSLDDAEASLEVRTRLICTIMFDR